MRMRSIISICLLTIYAIVVGHNFIPHHHHSEFAESNHICHHKDHHHIETSYSNVGHNHNTDAHSACSFNEKIILTKALTLSAVHFPANPFLLLPNEQNIQLLTDSYHLILLQDPNCRDVQLRGPPQFS